MTTARTDAGRSIERAQQRVLLALLPGALTLLLLNGWGTLWQLILCLLSGIACQVLSQSFKRGPALPPAETGSTLISAVLLGLALPALAPWWVALSACAFAIIMGKGLFGGYGRNLFNPAMLGYAFALISFPAALSQWPAEASDLSSSLAQVFGLAAPDGWSQATALDALRNNDRLTFTELSTRHPAFGVLGDARAQWAGLAFAGGGLWLLQQKIIRWQAPTGMLGALLVISLLCWNGTGSDSHGSPLLHLFSGATLLAAFFIVTEPVSGPRHARAQLYFGIGAGLLTYLIRTWGSFPDGVAFAVLLMNLCVIRLERLGRAR